ncbi:MAG: Crp/Fnr family transcriptional regulator [Meiothermus sp.]|uniref:Crp/Fnr family transcriptional regulator n=1 Tax=Meiothermus sp. TaxID=1955249 RepID=UPI00298F023E|nr:Crp/Fnr family transcriptional regulator [Meiothermus sp.]MDW8426479.1 Crp/Fnr family transcriptional regulator [Meiothermus sp.]
MQLSELKPVEVLARCPLFQGVSPDRLASLTPASEWLELTRGQTLFLQGDPVERLYLVAQGLIKVFRHDPRGRKQVVMNLAGPGQCVAAVALFLGNPRYPASAEAGEPSRILAVSGASFFRLVQQDHTLCYNLLRATAQHTGQIVQVLDRMVFREVDSRLAEYLLSMARIYGHSFKLPTNPEIAAIVGTTPEPVSRKLGHFSQQGWVEMNKRRIRITNPMALQKLAQAT